MKRILTSMLLTFLLTSLKAQLGCKKSISDEGEVTSCFHSNGKLSTQIIKLKNDTRWYRIRIFNAAGDEIYSSEYGAKWGSSNVQLSYYENGQVKSAHYTMQPDGGIQYHDVTTYFTVDGSKEREEDNSLDNYGSPRLLLPTEHSPDTKHLVHVKVPTPASCTPVKVPFDLYIINYTSDLLRLNITNTYNFDLPAVKQIEAGDTIFISSFYDEPGNVLPLTQFRIELNQKAKRGYTYQINHISTSESKKQFVAITLRKFRK